MFLRLHQNRSLDNSVLREFDLLLPTLIMSAISVVSSVAIRTIWCIHKGSNSFKVKRMALSSQKFLCNLLFGMDHMLTDMK